MDFIFNLVTRMGFEPMNVALRGQCVNHFTNEPYKLLVYYILFFLYFQGEFDFFM